MEYNLKEIFECFQAKGRFLRGEPYGSGHIHDTFRIETVEKESDDYILQRLNNKVFINIPELQQNIERVTIHLINKLKAVPGTDLKRECLNLIPARDGKSWIIDSGGSYWRMYIFITNHRSYNIVDSADKAYEGGKAIGQFQALLSDMPGGPLFETIPNFHDIEKRLETFNLKVKEDTVGYINISHKRGLLFVPFYNLKISALYLKYLLGRYDNNWSIALAAYNWGETKVDKRIKGRKIVSGENYVILFSDIPETRQFINKILK